MDNVKLPSIQREDGGRRVHSGSKGLHQPYSARNARENDKEDRLLIHEDVVRSVYKKHAQQFFEDMKDSFSKEVTAMRKQAQQGLDNTANTTYNEAWDPAASEAAGIPQLQATSEKLVKQVAELQQQVAHQSHVLRSADARGGTSAAIMARLDQQQQELKSLFRHMQSQSAGAKKAALVPMWKERALQEIAQGELRAVCADEVEKTFKDLTSNLDDQQVEAAVLRLCERRELPWETRQRAELQALTAHLEGQLAERSARNDEGPLVADLVKRCDALEQGQRNCLSRLSSLDTALAVELPSTATLMQRCKILEEGAEARATQQQALEEDIRKVRQAAEAATAESKQALSAAGALASTAKEAQAAADSARSLATGAVETVAQTEASIVQHGMRIGALEEDNGSLRHRVEHLDDNTMAAFRKLADGLQTRLGACELRLDSLARQADAGADGKQTAEPSVPQPAVAAAAADGLLTEQLAQQLALTRNVTEATAQQTLRLEHLERRAGELHRHAQGLGDELAAQARRQAEAICQHSGRLSTLEEQVRDAASRWRTAVGRDALVLAETLAFEGQRLERLLQEYQSRTDVKAQAEIWQEIKSVAVSLQQAAARGRVGGGLAVTNSGDVREKGPVAVPTQAELKFERNEHEQKPWPSLPEVTPNAGENGQLGSSHTSRIGSAKPSSCEDDEEADLITTLINWHIDCAADQDAVDNNSVAVSVSRSSPQSDDLVSPGHRLSIH